LTSYTTIPPAGGKLRGSVLSALITELRPPTAVRVTDGSPVNNSTVLVADDVLTVSLEANLTYLITAWLVTTSANAADVKIGCTIPSGAAGLWSMVSGPTTETTAIPGSVDLGAASLAATHTRVGAGTSTAVGALIYGYITTSSTAGTFTITMAQATATVADTTMKAGSWLKFQRTA
jgi:hypothetical protein